MTPPGAARMQEIEHAKKILEVRRTIVRDEQRRLAAEEIRFALRIQALDNELAAIFKSHLVDA